MGTLIIKILSVIAIAKAGIRLCVNSSGCFVAPSVVASLLLMKTFRSSFKHWFNFIEVVVAG